MRGGLGRALGLLLCGAQSAAWICWSGNVSVAVLSSACLYPGPDPGPPGRRPRCTSALGLACGRSRPGTPGPRVCAAPRAAEGCRQNSVQTCPRRPVEARGGRGQLGRANVGLGPKREAGKGLPGRWLGLQRQEGDGRLGAGRSWGDGAPQQVGLPGRVAACALPRWGVLVLRDREGQGGRAEERDGSCSEEPAGLLSRAWPGEGCAPAPGRQPTAGPPQLEGSCWDLWSQGENWLNLRCGQGRPCSCPPGRNPPLLTWACSAGRGPGLSSGQQVPGRPWVSER